MAYGILTSSIAVCLSPSILLLSRLLLSELTICRQSTPLADLHEDWLSSMDLMTLGKPVALITVEERWRNAVEETDNRDPKGDKVPLVENCI